MSKRFLVVFCALLMIAVAMPAFAAVQNVKVSGDIEARYIHRNDFDLTKTNGTVGADDYASVFNSVARLRVDADLTDNVQTVLRLINERNWGTDTATSSDIDLDLAYVNLKEFLCSPLTLAVGRQELHFGNDFLIGDGVGPTNRTTNYTEAAGYGTRNGDLSPRKSFDAIRATLNYDPLVIDLVYAVVNSRANSVSNEATILTGINAGYQFKDKWSTLVEGYFWSKNDKNATGLTKGDKVQTLGVRASTNPTQKLNIQQEIAWQSGTKQIASTAVSRPISAMALQTMATVTPGWKYDPTMGLVYSYYSGDRNPGNTGVDKAYHAWDPMYENQTAGHIINALYSATNCHNINLKGSMKPMEDVTLKLDYVYLMLAKNFLDATAANRTISNDYNNIVLNGATKSQVLGSEIDANLIYDYTEDVQFGLLAGVYMPGKAVLKDAAQSREWATETIASCKVSF